MSTKNISIWWDVYTSKVDRESDRWAVSDRGWLFRQGEESSLGTYLDYGPAHYRGDISGPAGRESIHAVCYAPKAISWHQSPESARLWIEKQCGLSLCPVNPTPTPSRTLPERVTP